MEWMLLASDGSACDVLMKLAAGPNAVNAYLKELKITDIVVRNPERQWRRTTHCSIGTGLRLRQRWPCCAHYMRRI
jgi:hypothetical protein